MLILTDIKNLDLKILQIIMRKISIIVLTMFVVLFIKQNIGYNDNGTNILKNVEMKPFAVPIQEKLSKNEKKQVFTKKIFGGKSLIRPLYKYKIYAIVYSKHRYILGIDPNPAPYDLALGWNGLEKPEVFESIRTWQCFRWVHWQLKKNCPYNINQVYLRLANNHVIPANDNILKGIKKLKKRDIVYMEGYLVSFETTIGNRKGSGVSSTTRNDRKANSCEIMYVTKLVSRHGEFK